MDLKDLILNKERASELSVPELLERMKISRTSKVTGDGKIVSRTTQDRSEKKMRKLLEQSGMGAAAIEIAMKEMAEAGDPGEGVASGGENSKEDTPQSNSNPGEAEVPTSREYTATG